MGSTGKLAVDVTVIHPLAPSQHHSLTLATSCIKAAENRKTALYETVCGNAGLSFSPCALNTFGALGVDAVALLRRISVIKEGQAPPMGLPSPPPPLKLKKQLQRPKVKPCL